MVSIAHYKINRFWLCYFFIRIFYLLFTVLVFARLTTHLGDTGRYLLGNVPFSLRIFYDSTYLMDYFGGIIGRTFRRNMLLSNFPATLISFFTVKWVVEKLSLRKHVNHILLMVMISFPNFSIWTSIWSKETFGLVFSSIIAVLIINFLNGKYRIKIIDIFGLYLCLLFNPQYIPFILQGLVFIYIARNLMNNKPAGQLMLGVFFLCVNVLFLYAIRDIVNMYAEVMHRYFATYGAGSTRPNIFLEENDFFRYLPWGMFIAFFGPTLDEMMQNPLHAVAGLESLFKIVLFFYLSKYIFIRLLLKSRISPIIPLSYGMFITGILFMHYPFGVFNPGSAIRYRSRFVFLFVVLLLYLYGQGRKYYLVGKGNMCTVKEKGQ